MDTHMDWNDLKIVLAIHRAGSLKGAARTLKVNQSTIGRRLSAIEAELGIILFIRDRQGFEATDAGRKVIKRANCMDFEIMRLENDLQSAGEEVSGVVRIVTNPWIATHLMAPNLPLLLDHHPDLKIHTLTGSATRNLAAREAEIALWFEREANHGEVSFLIGTVTYAVYGPEGADPSGLKWLTYWDDRRQRAPMRWFTSKHPGEAPLMMANDVNAVCSGVRAGFGKALMPTPVGDVEPGLVRLTNGAPELLRKLQAIVHPDMAGEANIRTTVGWLRRICGGGQDLQP
ncbi:MAG: LysR family transcriptional regulator [Minwuiales bacterium]|nr:LysR family transcriptional regulator [Minwuiales bacterium]